MLRTMVNLFNRIAGVLMMVVAMALAIQVISDYQHRGALAGGVSSVSGLVGIALAIGLGLAMASSRLGRIRLEETRTVGRKASTIVEVSGGVMLFLRVLCLAFTVRWLGGELPVKWLAVYVGSLAIIEFVMWRARAAPNGPSGAVRDRDDQKPRRRGQ